MNDNDFASFLEDALGHADTFFTTILPRLTKPSPEQMTCLCQVLQSGGVVARQLVAKLFTDHLGEGGANFLKQNLTVDQPKLFVEVAAILGALKYELAIDSLAKGLSPSVSELVLPTVKAISMLPPSRKVDEILVRFYLEFPDESKLSPSIRFLLNQQKSLVHEMLEKYRTLGPDRRMWVLKFLAETNNSEALKLFAEELQAEPLERGLYCIRGLGQIASEAAVEILKKHASHSEWFIRKRIVEAFGATGKASTIEPLLARLHDESMQVRGAAVESLSKVGNLNPDLLIKKLETADKTIRMNLVRAMGQLKNEKFVQSLIGILKERETLFFSIDAIGDLGFAQAEFSLRRLLKDEIWFNRLNALEALAKLPIQGLDQIALEASQDENDMVRNAAARILAGIKNSRSH
ncbi:MAG: HEAT repeat domain-containing protein [Candidatus Riflebacteria bacterium]|nr:HEAT repeat domain-containing protein [Candidatus Riflebacteria bacterium]